MNNTMWKGLNINEEERIRTESSLRVHWHDNSICMMELIRAEYDDGHDCQNVQNNNVTVVMTEASKESHDKATPNGSLMKEYFVIVDYDFDLDWIVDEGLHSDFFEQISSKVTIIKSMPHSTLAPVQKLEFMRLLGNALVAAIHNQYFVANRLLIEARNFVIHRLSEYSRTWTLLTACIVLILAILMYWGIEFGAWSNACPLWRQGCIWGIIGAFLSIARRTGKESRDAEAGIFLHVINVIIKYLCAAILGIFGCLLLENGHILPSAISAIELDTNGAQIIGFICGFCENFIPNLIMALPLEK